MDSPAPRRKMKFAPKAPPRRVPKPEVKNEVVQDTQADAVEAKDLLRRFNESAMKAKLKVEKKVASSQIAFGYGGESASIKSWSGVSSSQNSTSKGVTEKEYKEPWDYYSNYPVTLPLRRPYSGNPDLLDKEEFGEAEEPSPFEENSINSVKELGLLEDNPEPSILMFQLPPQLPMVKLSAAAKGQVTGSSKPPSEAEAAEKPCNLDEVPAGFMGKLLVYKSGAIKLKLGDTLFDVSSGVNRSFAEDVVAVNTAEKHCSAIGEIGKHATISLDIDGILDCANNL